MAKLPTKPTKPKKPKKEPTAKVSGKHYTYTDEVADRICSRIANGESLKRICTDADMPSTQTVFTWLRTQDGFLDKYMCARDEQAEFYADEITEIADTCEDPAKARVQIDARKWIAAKLKPKKFGEKVVQEITGADGAPILWGVPAKNNQE